MRAGESIDTLIVGQGLAGTLLAWALIERGQRVLVVDREEALTSSRVAAGIVTPITGQRLVCSWRLGEMAAAALATYRRIEARLGKGTEFFRDMPIRRMLNDEREASRWRKRADDPSYLRWLSADKGGAVEPDTLRGLRAAPAGWFEMLGWQLDVPGFLDASRAWLADRGMYRAGEVPANAAAIDVDEVSVGVPSVEARVGMVVFCQGWRAGEGDLFDWVPFRPGKGELMEVEIGCGVDTGGRIINRNGWLLPLGGGRYRCGATYSWSRVDDVPTAEGREELVAKLEGILSPGVDYSIVGHRAGVRPVIRESRALMGRHPADGLERVAFLNGFGSKGVLNGPWFAEHLAAHLVDGAPIDEELDLRRNG